MILNISSFCLPSAGITIERRDRRRAPPCSVYVVEQELGQLSSVPSNIKVWGGVGRREQEVHTTLTPSSAADTAHGGSYFWGLISTLTHLLPRQATMEDRAGSRPRRLPSHLMMLAAAFRSWIRRSGSCTTSPRKQLTLYLSVSSLWKSCGKMDMKLWLWLQPPLQCFRARLQDSVYFCPWRLLCFSYLVTISWKATSGASHVPGTGSWDKTELVSQLLYP